MFVFEFVFIFIILFVLLVSVGLSALFVFLCRNMAREKGLPDTWMWFGLLGLIGILIVALKDPVKPYTYNQYGPNGQYGPGGYVQNPQYGQQYTQYPNGQYGQMYNQYQQGQAQQYGQMVQNPQYGQMAQASQYNQYQQTQGYDREQTNQGYNLNGVMHSETAGTICSFCGMKVSSETKECPVCGSKVN